MGCDIHGHVEIKINGDWHHLRDYSFRRSYRLFAYLAGVRVDKDNQPEKILSQDRGFPEDATVLTRHDYEVRWGEDAHTPGYINWQEIGEVMQWLDKNNYDPYDNNNHKQYTHLPLELFRYDQLQLIEEGKVRDCEMSSYIVGGPCVKVKVFTQEEPAFGYFFGNYIDSPLRYPDESKHLGIEDVRYVFWFDN